MLVKLTTVLLAARVVAASDRELKQRFVVFDVDAARS